MKRETLLIVEDNQVLRDGLREILAVEGFHVVTAGNGKEGLHQMSIIAPDLILSDITMPEMDGITFCKKVRSRPDWLTIPFIFLTARGEKSDILEGKILGAEDYLTKPITREELISAVRGRLERSRQLQMVQQRQAFEASLTALANAIELRDRYTRTHVEAVMQYSLVLADLLGWKDKRLDQIRFGAILHDIGKIDIHESILNKPGRLSEEEWAQIRRHPVLGAEMIKDIPYLTPAIPVIRHHHERWDGKGYPDGLAREEIPQGARIVALADAFEAMTSVRLYVARKTIQEAHDEILICSGTQFDPQVVAAFEDAWKRGLFQEIAAKLNPERTP